MIISASDARKNFFNLLDTINQDHKPIMIYRSNNKEGGVLISEKDWNAIQETLFLQGIPGMVESIQEGMNTPIEECIPESEVDW